MNIADMSRLAFFKVDKYEYKDEHICDFRNIPRPHFCMGLLLRGSAVFTPEDGTDIYINPGDIIFVPITSRYISRWIGERDILYISMHFAFEPLCGISEQNRFALQRVIMPEINLLEQKFRFALSNYDADSACQMASLGAFFDVLGGIVPLLKQKKQQPTDKRIERATEYINLHSEQELTVAELAEMSCMSVANFHMQFKKYTSMTPIEYKNNISTGRAMRLLKGEECLSIEEISEMLGFESSSYFRRVFKKHTGKTPTEYRKNKIEL